MQQLLRQQLASLRQRAIHLTKQLANSLQLQLEQTVEYEIIVPADGIGDHPAFAILADTKTSLEKIGITLTINDPADTNVLWDTLDANTHEMWTAAWGSTIDPDMYQVYHSSNGKGRGRN